MSDYIDRIAVILAILLVGLAIIVTDGVNKPLNTGALLIVVLSFFLLLREYIVYCKEFIKEINIFTYRALSYRYIEDKSQERILEIFPISWWTALMIISGGISLFLIFYMNMPLDGFYVLTLSIFITIVIFSFRYAVMLLYLFRNGIPDVLKNMGIIFLFMTTIPLTIITALGEFFNAQIPISQLYTPINITKINSTYQIITFINSTNISYTHIDNYMMNDTVVYLSIGIGVLSALIYSIIHLWRT